MSGSERVWCLDLEEHFVDVVADEEEEPELAYAVLHRLRLAEIVKWCFGVEGVGAIVLFGTSGQYEYYGLDALRKLSAGSGVEEVVKALKDQYGKVEITEGALNLS